MRFKYMLNTSKIVSTQFQNGLDYFG